MALVVCTWLWGEKYPPVYVERLYRGVSKHLGQQFRFVCMTESDRIANFSNGIERHAIDDRELTKVQGCFARLRMFDPEWQYDRGVEDRLVCLDLDVVVTGSLDALFARPEDLLVLGGANASNPCPYNCSVMMLRRGVHPQLWSDFSLEAVASIEKYEFADDQGWLWHCLKDVATWRVGTVSGIYAFQKPGWPTGTDLPKDARLVSFIGWRDPSKFVSLPWVQKHWIN